MKKKLQQRIALLLTACVTFASFAGCTRLDSATEQEDTRPVVRVGSDVYPPYIYLDEDGVSAGIDVDLATEALGRMGYRCEFVYIDWEQKTQLVESGELDCLWGSFSMEGRLDDYRWAGPYMVSDQAVAVLPDSDIYTLADLEGRNIAMQSTSKPETIFMKRTDSRIPQVGTVISLEDRELIYTFLGKGYADAIAAHETAILQYMKDYDMDYRILDEKLMTVGIGVAFARDDDRGICEELDRVLEEMRRDGTSAQIIGRYLEDPEDYLEVDKLAY